MKKKICVVVDVKEWAFDHIAQKLKKGLDDEYDIRIDYFNRREEQDYFYDFIEKNDDCDLIHFLNRRTLLLIDTDIFKQKVEASGRDFDQYVNEKKKKMTTAVYDHIDIDSEGLLKLKPIYNDYTKMYYTCSQKLFDIYNDIPDIKNPEMAVRDVVDKDIFFPDNMDRFERSELQNRKLVIGWVGNSVHNDQGNVDLKGFHTVIKPVIDNLLNEGYQLIEHYADRNVIWRNCAEMSQYYHEIDLCLFASLHEGTPLPILEAMYSGVPVIITDVGIAKEVLGAKQQNFIIGDREEGKNDEKVKESLKEKIKELYANRGLLQELSNENLLQVKHMEDNDIMKDFKDFFERALEK